MPISEADALKAHEAIHSAKKSVTIASGATLPIETNSSKCRVVKFPEGVTAAEQNKAKPSKWAEEAKKGVKITWFLGGGSPAQWGRIVAGKLETRGVAIAPAAEAAAKAKATVSPKAAAESKATAAAVLKRPAASEPDDEGAEAIAAVPAAKRAKIDTTATAAATPSTGSKSTASTSPAASSSADPLGLSALFTGSGHGSVWEPILRPIIEGLPDAAAYIGPSRDKGIVPVRELTFQALKPNPPSGWRVVSFGQSPYPRIESATGIAHFDNSLAGWEDAKFGSIMTMRVMIKAAAMYKYPELASKETLLPDLRALLKSKRVVPPPEWFQAMLTQGVLFMNAACTLLPPKDKAERAGTAVELHRKFWQPAIAAVVDAILKNCSENNRGVVFAWWGSESLKTKKILQHVFNKFPGAKVEHIESHNPAAMGDTFCDKDVFGDINKALKKFKLAPVDWLPSTGWKASLPVEPSAAGTTVADEMGDFIAETQDLHKMYLERLRDGLDISGDTLADITGIAKEPLVSLSETCKALKLERAAEASVKAAKAMKRGKLTEDQAAAIHLYTTNHLYKRLNAALRSPSRHKAKQYFSYLRLFLAALEKIPASKKMLYRGVALDLSAQYQLGSEVVWWAVSSCTPDKTVASNFSSGSKSTIFLISSSRSVGIRDLSQYKSEEEFILAPGTSFIVSKVVKNAKLTEIHLQEDEKPRRVR